MRAQLMSYTILAALLILALLVGEGGGIIVT